MNIVLVLVIVIALFIYLNGKQVKRNCTMGRHNHRTMKAKIWRFESGIRCRELVKYECYITTFDCCNKSAVIGNEKRLDSFENYTIPTSTKEAIERNGWALI